MEGVAEGAEGLIELRCDLVRVTGLGMQVLHLQGVALVEAQKTVGSERVTTRLFGARVRNKDRLRTLTL